VVEARPKCSEHKLALELAGVENSQHVEISKDKVVTDVYCGPQRGCNTKRSRQQGCRTVEYRR
jgi:hypothetical protein